jgi:hypothetical protein
MKRWLLVLSFLVTVSTTEASPLYVTLDTGFNFFKYGFETTNNGFPDLAPAHWGIELGTEWSPSFLEKRGIWLRASFPWQSIGAVPGDNPPRVYYIDGPRVGIRFRGRIVGN